MHKNLLDLSGNLASKLARSLLFALGVSLLLSSCLTLGDFTNESDSLLVGEVVHTRLDTRGSRFPSGTWREGITVSIRNMESGQVFTTSTRENGFFFFRNLDEGVYELIETRFERQGSSEGRTVIWHLGASIHRYFIVTKGKVNNLGVITQDITDGWYTLTFDNYMQVRDNFRVRYPQLRWNDADWVDAAATLTTPRFLQRTESSLHTGDWNFALLDTARDVDYLTEFEKEIVLELNKVRSNPQKFAEIYIKPMLEHFDGYLYLEPGRGRVATHEGRIPVEELIEILSRMSSLPLLYPEIGLSLAARDHVNEQGPVGIFGHIGYADRSTPEDRVLRHGRRGSNFILGEIIAYGREEANAIIIGFLINDGNPARGHRRVILDPNFNQVGVSTGSHRRARTMCVIKLANGYISN